jgi:hypothetical protein
MRVKVLSRTGDMFTNFQLRSAFFRIFLPPGIVVFIPVKY